MSGNTLEFYIKMKDLMSSALTKVAKTAKDTGASIVGAFRKAQSGIDEATRSSKKFGASMDDNEKRMDKMGKMVKKFAGTIGIGLSAHEALNFVKESLKESSEAENAKIAFKVLTGDKYKGEALYGGIRKMADTTPFESGELMRAGKMLLGFGEKQENVLPGLQRMGDIASAQDNPAEALLGIAHAYGEVVASGKLMGRNTLELITWGFNPLKEISLMTGKSMEKLKKEEERGAISADMVAKAFKHATDEGGKYHNMMQEQAQTLSGQWSTFMDLVHAKMRAFGDTLAPMAKGIMAATSDLLGSFGTSELKGFGDETNRLKGLEIEYGLINTSNSRRLEIFRELKATYPDIVSGIDNERDALTKLIPALDNYLGKRYLAAGQLAIKSKFSGDLGAVADAETQMQETFGQSTSQAIMLAAKYGIAGGGTSGQLMGRVQQTLLGKMKALEPLRYRSGQDDANYSDVKADYEGLKGLIDQNKAAQSLWQQHIGGAKKAKEAVDKFNQVMGINSPMATGGASKTGAATATDSGSGVGEGIAKGGPRIINIHGVKFTDKIEIHSVDFKGGAKEVEEIFHDMFMRLLNSGAKVQ